MVVPAAGFVALLAYATLAAGSLPQPGDPIPDFEAPRLEGDGVVRAADLNGRPGVINFWWSGCVPCREEAPILERAHDAYGDRVAFLGINIKDARSDALAFADRYDLDYEHVRDESLDIYRAFGLTGQPETFFVDSNGVIVEHVAGPLTAQRLATLVDILVRRDA